MKLIRFFIMLCGLMTTTGLCPMNNKPTEQKVQTAEQDFELKTKAGKKAALFVVTNPKLLMLIAHYLKGHSLGQLSKYAEEPAFLAHIIGLKEIYNNAHSVTCKIKTPQQPPFQTIHVVGEAKEVTSPFYFAEDDDEFSSMLNADSHRARKEQEEYKRFTQNIVQSALLSSPRTEETTPQLTVSPYGAYTSPHVSLRPTSTPVDRVNPGRITPISSPKVLTDSLRSINRYRRLASVSASQLHELAQPKRIIITMKPLSEQTDEEKESLTVSFTSIAHNNAISEEETDEHDNESRHARRLPHENSVFFFPGDDEAELETENNNLYPLLKACSSKNAMAHPSPA